jgi:hypothetical protein
MLKLLLSLLFTVLLGQRAQAQFAKAPEAPCQWSQRAQVIHQGPHEVHQILTFTDSPVFWGHQVPKSASLAAFRQEVRALIPELEPEKHPPAVDDDEGHNKRLAVSGREGQLQPINCLEALLLSEQTARLPMLKQPSEFGAFVLRKADALGAYQYKVYFSTQDQPGLRMNGQVMDLIDADRQAGWSVWAHLHNHNFFPDKADPFASPSPSKTDVEFARMMQDSLNLANLWVTNGFDTLHLPQADFQLYQGHGDAR